MVAREGISSRTNSVGSGRELRSPTRGDPSAPCLGRASSGSKMDEGGGKRRLGDASLGGRWLGLVWARYTALIGRLGAGGGGYSPGSLGVRGCRLCFPHRSQYFRGLRCQLGGSVSRSEVLLDLLIWALVTAPARVGIKWRTEAP